MRTKSDELPARLLELATACAAGSLFLQCATPPSEMALLPETAPPPEAAPPVAPGPSTSASSGESSSAAPTSAPGHVPANQPAQARLCPDADWHPLHGLKPAQEYDYVALMQRLARDSGPAEMRWALGEKCKGARSPEACSAEIDRLAASVQGGRLQPGQISSQHYLVTTRGDEVRAWTSREDWLRFLGPIDTTAEALLLAWYDLYSVECVEPAPGGYALKATRMTRDCAPMEITEYALRVSPAGKLDVDSSKVISRSGACVGRRAPGHVASARRTAPSQLGAFFASVAELEGASVTAFQRIAQELRVFHAPEALVLSARQAASDEIRHAFRMGRLALGLGAEPGHPAIAPSGPRSLEQAARDNAVEGCIRETFGALVGSYQVLNARHPSVRSIMAAVARDERDHAAFSWRLHAWFDERLPARARRRIQHEQRRAFSGLRREWREDPAPELMTGAGLPSARAAQRLLDALEAL